MYEINVNKQFKSAYKRITQSGRFKREEFEKVVKFLKDGIELPSKYHDHALLGNYFGLRECHIAGDVLLIYEIDSINRTITLANIGNHANLF